MKVKKRHNSDSDDDMSSNSQQLNTDVTPKYIPIAKFGDRLHTKKIIINISDTQYPIIEEIAEEFGWTIQRSEGKGNWDLWWTDRQITPNVLFRMHLHQKINHFPGIYVLARKNLLGLNLMCMRENFPQEYDFFPETWVIPLQFHQFRQHYESIEKGKTRTYIVKPEAQSQGRGIFLTRNIDDITNGHKYVIQRYLKTPFLIDGLKFDLRIYVLLAGTDPLRLYIYDEGLARFATQKYQQPTDQNLNRTFIHLTNYSLNKNNPDFIYNDSDKDMNTGHKRTLTAIYETLTKMGYDSNKLRSEIQDVIVKTTLTSLPLISHQYEYCQPEQYEGNMCFHILGFDILLLENLKPIVLEVNHTPSFETSTPLDYYVKKNLIKDTLVLMRIASKTKKTLFERGKMLAKKRLETGKREIVKGKQRQQLTNQFRVFRDAAEKNLTGKWKRVHPLQDQAKQQQYKRFLEHAKKIHKENRETRKRILKQSPDKSKEDYSRKLTESPKKGRNAHDLPILTNTQIGEKEKQSSSPERQLNFRTTTKRRSPSVNNNEMSLDKFNELMTKFLISKDIGQHLKVQEQQESINFAKIKRAFLEKKPNFNSSSTRTNESSMSRQNLVGSFLVPRNYQISDDRERYPPVVCVKSAIKTNSDGIKTLQYATRGYDKIRRGY